MKPFRRLLIAAAALLLSGCEPGPTPILYGSDACAHCKMTIVDRHFGAQVVHAHGRTWSFDSVECLVAYEIAGSIAAEDVHSRWVTPFGSPETLMPAEAAVYLVSESLRSPMGMNLSAHSDTAEARRALARHGGELKSWAELTPLVRAAWFAGNRSSENGQGS